MPQSGRALRGTSWLRCSFAETINLGRRAFKGFPGLIRQVLSTQRLDMPASAVSLREETVKHVPSWEELVVLSFSMDPG